VSIWAQFKDPALLSAYRWTEILAEDPHSRERAMDATKDLPLFYIVTGGPRGLETPDAWRLDREFPRAWPGFQASLIDQRYPLYLKFDDYFRRVDPTEIWLMKGKS
jgi:hypothetical protein